MWLIRTALRRPYTFVVMAILISVIDDKYRDLLARAGKLEAKVFAPRRR
jgi:hypothetical protein